MNLKNLRENKNIPRVVSVRRRTDAFLRGVVPAALAARVQRRAFVTDKIFQFVRSGSGRIRAGGYLTAKIIET